VNEGGGGGCNNLVSTIKYATRPKSKSHRVPSLFLRQAIRKALTIRTNSPFPLTFNHSMERCAYCQVRGLAWQRATLPSVMSACRTNPPDHGGIAVLSGACYLFSRFLNTAVASANHNPRRSARRPVAGTGQFSRRLPPVYSCPPTAWCPAINPWQVARARPC
jgi:hypothetical protein